MKRMWLLTGFLLSVVSVSLSGCALMLIGAGVAAGVGTVAYVNGELKGTEEVTLDKAWQATQQAMQDLQFKVTKSEKDALAGELIALRADNTRIVIRLKQQSDKVTEIRIRVGTFGDETLARLIFDKIKKRF